MEKPERKILYDEQGLKFGTEFKRGQWKEIVSHNEKEIKGFFGEYRFLSNFWPAKVFLDNEEYSTTENAYQAAKYKKESRDFLKSCSPKEAIIFIRDNIINGYSIEEWDKIKLGIMKNLLEQKFDKNLNAENYVKLLETGDKYLEETNYWGDVFWGVNKNDPKEKGVGENNLGKLLMEIRKNLIDQMEEKNG
ncbi:MAG: NADAR family protein [bacterium]